jgi:hypothetical protein
MNHPLRVRNVERLRQPSGEGEPGSLLLQRLSGLCALPGHARRDSGRDGRNGHCLDPSEVCRLYRRRRSTRLHVSHGERATPLVCELLQHTHRQHFARLQDFPCGPGSYLPARSLANPGKRLRSRPHAGEHQACQGQAESMAISTIASVLRFLSSLLRARLNGSYRSTPFFAPDRGTPVVSPKVLSRSERERVMKAVG